MSTPAKTQIPDDIYHEMLSAAVTAAQIIVPSHVERILNAAVTILESHLSKDDHIVKTTKEVGGYPVEFETRPCYRFFHPGGHAK